MLDLFEVPNFFILEKSQWQTDTEPHEQENQSTDRGVTCEYNTHVLVDQFQQPGITRRVGVTQSSTRTVRRHTGNSTVYSVPYNGNGNGNRQFVFDGHVLIPNIRPFQKKNPWPPPWYPWGCDITGTQKRQLGSLKNLKLLIERVSRGGHGLRRHFAQGIWHDKTHGQKKIEKKT